MREFILILLVGILIAGCVNLNGNGNTTTNNSNNNTNSNNKTNQTIPPGYEVKDYCKADNDCVRQEKCCDCGLGEYVNKYNLNNTPCNGPRCMCATRDSTGFCQNNKCIGVQVTETPSVQPPINESPTNQTPNNETQNNLFCGWSTNASCKTSNDCITGGCSGRVCQSKNEKSVITTCEYRDCYNAQAAGVSCGCIAGKCQWN